MIEKSQDKDDEVRIYDDALIYKRGEYWHFRMWLSDEDKYARKSLRTRNRTTAIDEGKKLYIEISHNKLSGRKYFSLTTKQGVEKYIQERQKDVESGLIVSGRLTTIKTHLKHFLDYIGRDTKLKELHISDCKDYFDFRLKRTRNKVKQVTIKNEQSTINALIDFLFRNGDTHISGFEFKKLPRIDTKSDAVRRSTFTHEEHRRLCRAARSYASKSKNKLSDDEYYVRQIVRYYILIAGNSGLRVGEQRQLMWRDVSTEKHNIRGEELTLARINVRAETSKVRKSRVFLCRSGQQFDSLKKLSKYTTPNDYLFTVDGINPISKKTLYSHFKTLLELAEIDTSDDRKLVIYSLRHFMITQRIMSGLDFRQVADMCGTSVEQIEKTYWHVDDKTRLTNAVADHFRDKDGRIVQI